MEGRAVRGTRETVTLGDGVGIDQRAWKASDAAQSGE